MPRTHGIQCNYTAGELSPKLYGRFDVSKYSNGAKKVRNMIVFPQGGATRRPGWHFVDTLKTMDKAGRLIPFIYSNEVSYQLVFEDGVIRFIKDQYLMYVCAGAEALINGDFTHDLGYWTNVDTGTGTSTWNSNRMKLTGGSGGAAARRQEAKVDNGYAYTLTFDVSASPIKLRVGTTAGGAEIVNDKVETVGCHTEVFTATGDSVFVEFRNVANNDAYVTHASLRRGNELLLNSTFNTDILPWTDKSTGTGSIGANNGVMEIAGGATGVGWAEQAVPTVTGKTYCVMFDVSDHPVEVVTGTTSGASDIELETSPADEKEIKFIFTAVGTTTYIGFKNASNTTAKLDNVFCREWVVFEISSPYSESELPDLRYLTHGIEMRITSPDHPPYILTCNSDVDWTLEQAVFIDGPYTDQKNDITISSSAASGDVTLTASAPLWEPGHEGSLWRLGYGATNTSWGYVQITDFTDSQHVAAKVMTTISTSATSWYRENAWSDVRGYPRTVMFSESRIIYGGTYFQPQTFWGSKTGEYETMTPGTLDNDPYTYTMGASEQGDQIQWMANVKALIMGTGGEELKAVGGSDNPITPTNIKVTSEGNDGSAWVAPVRIKNVVLFLQAATRKIKELVYEWTNDSYVTQDLTLLGEHLTEAGIRELAYQKEPNSLVWGRDGFGNLLGMTYLREQSVVACHYHETLGTVESISTIPNFPARRNDLYAIINRTVGRRTVRYIEYQDPGINVDCGLTYEGDPVASVAGLNHLEGETVDIVGDGAVYPSQVVTDGSVSLQGSTGCQKISVGLHYDSELETLRPEFPINGTSQGIPKAWGEIWVRVYRTIGCTINGRLVKFRTADDNMGEGVAPFTGDKRVDNAGWGRDATISIKQTQPLPMTILCHFGTIDLGD